VAPFESV
jgi:hypothetical protein